MTHVRVLGVPVLAATAEDAATDTENAALHAAPARVVYVNAHTLNLTATDPAYREVIRRSAVVLNDGAGLQLAARMQRTHFPANLNGTDFTPRILRVAARHGWPVFFLGGADGVASQAAGRLQNDIPGLVVAGAHSGYFPPEQAEQVAADIRATGAQVVLVGMGNPRQEFWLDEHLDATGARLGIGVGAFLDFASGRVPRAPAWAHAVGVEWVHRLALEPARLWRRYLLGNPLFVLRVFRDRRGAASSR